MILACIIITDKCTT